MKNIIVFIFFLSTTSIVAQSNSANPSSSIRIEMLFPEGKSKAIILSFDDGTISDRRLVQLMNDYALKGTFHLNSNKLNTKGYLTKEEIKSLFSGHEVSVHSANHPGLSGLSKIDIVNEVIEDRKELERLTGSTIRGMAYPFGSYDDLVVETISGLGIEYARTVADTLKFSDQFSNNQENGVTKENPGGRIAFVQDTRNAHQLFSDISLTTDNIRTFVSKNGVTATGWWGMWSGTGKFTKNKSTTPVHAYFYWKDDKIISGGRFFDPTLLKEEFAASQK